jgi:hypothetical protein
MIGAIVDDLYVAAGGAHVAGPGEGAGPAPDDGRDTGPGRDWRDRVVREERIPAARRSWRVGCSRARGRRTDRAEVPPGPVRAPRRAPRGNRPADNVDALEAAIDRGIHIGRHRTLTQDSEFGIAQVVEIAIRALSPAINDTFTGVACVDWLADALLTLAERPPLEGNWYDTGSRLRVWMPPVRLERLVKLAFDQIRQASATTPAVLIRQL